MKTSLETFIFNFLLIFRWVGMIVLAIGCMGILLSETIKSKLSATKIISLLACSLLAAVAFWVLPTLMNYARSDAGTFIPNFPIGSYR
ncbi:hypothetical protein [Nocardia iowensis]|uniref:Uncharacterized protein n=1 Tax=Nocardia iowensis TaxID=204891 RepID=A0ABX8S098_NOCIO|nr:hypothetical protein [Nocardia iowensis]QXN94647.1 hypothetical protein KV110_17290 [Nocardia iowensis]